VDQKERIRFGENSSQIHSIFVQPLYVSVTEMSSRLLKTYTKEKSLHSMENHFINGTK